MSEQAGTPAVAVGGSHAMDASRGVSGTVGATHDAGAAGAAGATVSATVECTKDDDCADGKACNGAESCHDGHCQAGDAVSCPSNAECVEAEAGAACRYASSDRFVVYTGQEFGNVWDDAVAVSISQLEHPVRLNFSEGATDKAFNMIVKYRWSPDGRRLIFAAQCTDFDNDVWDQKFFSVDVTQALAGQPRRLPNIRIDDGGTFDFLGWSPTSNSIVIGRDGERYAVRFSESGAETAQLEANGSIFLCGDDATVAYSTETETRLATAWGAASDETVLPAKVLSSSPDGRWLLLSDEQHAYLARCSPGATLEALGGPARATSSWSPNSEYVVYSDTSADWSDGSAPNALSAYRVESSNAHAPLFEAVAADPRVSFEPGTTRFLFVEKTPENALVFQLVDLASPSSRVVLPMPGGVGSGNNIVVFTPWLGTTGYLSYDASEGDNPGRYSIEATANATPRLLVRAGSFSDFQFSDDGTRAIWLEGGDGSFGALNQAYTLDLTRSDSQPHALFAEPLPGMVSLSYPRIISRFTQDPSYRMDLFAIPADFESEPVLINVGNVTAGPVLQPQP